MVSTIAFILLLTSLSAVVSEVPPIQSIPMVTTEDCGVTRRTPRSSSSGCFKWHNSHFTRSDIKSGRNAAEGELPFVAQIMVDHWNGSKTGQEPRFRFLCSGSILNPRWIITAAHCFFCGAEHQYNCTASNVWVIVGSNGLRNGSYHQADKLIQFPGYAYSRLHSIDIGLIKLNSSITMPLWQTNSVCLPKSRYVSYGREFGVIAGWGLTSNTSLLQPRHLQTGTVVFYMAEDEQGYNYLEATEAKFNGSMVCGGDSGGPMIQWSDNRAVLVGVTSSSSGKGYCPDPGPDAYSVEVLVADFIDWITYQITMFNQNL